MKTCLSMFVLAGADINQSQNKADLLAIAKAMNVEKLYRVDKLAKAAGHEIIRLPPYHCKFNPIELLWAYMKVIVISFIVLLHCN